MVFVFVLFHAVGMLALSHLVVVLDAVPVHLHDLFKNLSGMHAHLLCDLEYLRIQLIVIDVVEIDFLLVAVSGVTMSSHVQVVVLLLLTHHILMMHHIPLEVVHVVPTHVLVVWVDV